MLNFNLTEKEKEKKQIEARKEKGVKSLRLLERKEVKLFDNKEGRVELKYAKA